jgi:hypothetical protein
MPTKIRHSKILNKYRQALLTHFPDQLQRLILFGSQARGQATEASDIDLLVVVNWDEERLADGRYAIPFRDPRWQRMIEMAYDLSLEYGVLLSPLIMSQKRFEQWSPLVERIKHDGIELWSRN